MRLILLLLVLLPVPWIIGVFHFHLIVTVLLGVAAVVLTVPLFRQEAPPAPRLDALVKRLGAFSLAQSAGAKLLGIILLSWFVYGFWLLGTSISNDIYAVHMQALTFASGHLYAPAPPVPEAFTQPRFLVVRDIWISQYPPGQALLLVPFVMAGLPIWLAPGLFAAGIVALFWKIARRRIDEHCAALAVAALVTSAFFVFNATTLYAHAPAAFFGLAAAFSIMKYREGRSLFWVLLAGMSIGAMGTMRPFNAFLFICVLGPVLLADWWREKTFRSVMAMVIFGLGGIPFAVILFGYNVLITGSPFTTIQSWVGVTEPVGLISIRSLALTVERMAGLALTTSPVLLLAGMATLPILWQRKKLHFTDLLFPVTVIGFLFYGGRGGAMNSYGPRYLFEVFPFLVLSCAALVSVMGPARPLVQRLTGAHFALQLALLLSWFAFERAAIHYFTDPFRVVARQQLENALVIVEKAPSGFRITGTDDYTRNGINVYEPSVVFARDSKDVKAGRKALRAAFPDRAFWVYRDGTLEPLDPHFEDGSGLSGEEGTNR